MELYTVSDAYIAWLKLIDNRVPDNYQGKRAFIGVVLDINGHQYLAPLTSYKPKQDKLKNSSPTIFKLHERSNPANKLGMVSLHNMVPVLTDTIELLDLPGQPEPYRKMLYRQYEFIKRHAAEIKQRAAKLHKIVTVDKQAFLCSLCCDFALLEQEYRKYST